MHVGRWVRSLRCKHSFVSWFWPAPFSNRLLEQYQKCPFCCMSSNSFLLFSSHFVFLFTSNDLKYCVLPYFSAPRLCSLLIYVCCLLFLSSLRVKFFYPAWEIFAQRLSQNVSSYLPIFLDKDRQWELSTRAVIWSSDTTHFTAHLSGFVARPFDLPFLHRGWAHSFHTHFLCLVLRCHF